MTTYLFKIGLKDGPVVEDSVEARSSREARLIMEARYRGSRIMLVGTR